MKFLNRMRQFYYENKIQKFQSVSVYDNIYHKGKNIRIKMNMNQLSFSGLFARTRPHSQTQFSHSSEKPNEKLGNWVSLSNKDNSIPPIERNTRQQHLSSKSTGSPSKNSSFTTYLNKTRTDFSFGNFSKNLYQPKVLKRKEKRTSKNLDLNCEQGYFERESTRSSFNSSSLERKGSQSKTKQTVKGSRFSKLVTDQQLHLKNQNAIIFYRQEEKDLKISGKRILF